MSMEYDPRIQYRGDTYAFAGLSGFGKDVGEKMAKDWEDQRRQQQLLGYNNAIVNHAKESGLISQDELNAYNAASLSQKTSIAAGYAANIHDDLQRQLTGVKIKSARQELDQRNQLFPIQIQNAKTEAATAEAIAENAGKDILDDKTGLIIGKWDAHGRPSYFRQPAGGEPGHQPAVATLVDPSTGKKFSLFSRGPNQWDLTPGSAPNAVKPAGTKEYDDEGNLIGLWNAKGTITKLTKPAAVDPFRARMAAMMDPDGGGTAPGAPKFQPGTKIRQGGKVYKFDGQNWVEVTQ